MEESQIRALFVDFGNVCAMFHFERFTAKFINSTGVDQKKLEDFLFDGKTGYGKSFSQLERGEIGAPEFFNRLTTELNCSDKIDYNSFQSFWVSVFMRENEELSKLLSKVSVPMFLLSNTNRIAYVHYITETKLVRQHFPLQEHRILSFRVGSIKPDPQIFHYALEKVGVKPSEALFIDDVEENIISWQKLGAHGIKYHAQKCHIEYLSKKFREFGILQ